MVFMGGAAWLDYVQVACGNGIDIIKKNTLHHRPAVNKDRCGS
jgi:hypothetical protein